MLKKAPKVFISHSKKNLRRARRLARALASLGVQVWFDEWELLLGQTITDRIYDGILNADYLIVLLSKHSVASKWVREELNIALVREIEQKGITVLPLVYEACEIPASLQKKRYIKVRVFEDAVREILAAIGIQSKADRFIILEPQDEFDRLEFSTEGLGRCLAGFLNNIRYIHKFTVVEKHDKNIQFNREHFWETYGKLMDASKEDFEEFASMKGLKDGIVIDGPTISELLLGTRNISLRNKALHFASILGVNYLLSRNLVELFEYKKLDFEGVVTKYLSLRERLCQEIGGKHNDHLGAMILFYMDVGITLYVKGSNTCAHIAADEGVINIIKARVALSIDSAKYFKSIGRQEELVNCALSWSELFRDKKRLVSDLEKLYDDLANKLKLVH